MNISKQVVIISAERKENTAEDNEAVTKVLKGCLNDCRIPFRAVKGVYNNGPSQTSLVAIVKDETDIQTLRDFAFKNFGQDSILHQDANQEATLINNDGTVTPLGRLQQVTKEVAVDKGSYTLMGDTYYTAIPRTV